MIIPAGLQPQLQVLQVRDLLDIIGCMFIRMHI